MSYAINAAKQSGAFGEIIVSTDDDELAHIARAYGCHVIRRNKDLAKDDVGLDEVIVDAVREYGNECHGTIKYVATIQATSPFAARNNFFSSKKVRYL